MIEYVRTILTGQFEAALCMLNQCVRACPPEHWEGKIANNTFRQVAYHTLFYVELYLSPGELHLNNTRHVPPPRGQLRASVRGGLDGAGARRLGWVKSGWR